LENVKSLSVTILNRGLDTRCCMGLGTEEIRERERERERERGFCVAKVKSEDSYRWKAKLGLGSGTSVSDKYQFHLVGVRSFLS
jgi:hypothetical protein